MVQTHRNLTPRSITFLAVWFLILTGLMFVPREMTAQGLRQKTSTRVADSANPFLRKYASAPVQWHEWGAASFDRSRMENKPIFLVIGHQSSPGFRSLQRKVLSNDEIARLLNENFVNLLVDHEMRPDLALLYQTALEVYLGETQPERKVSGPIVMFLTPEGKPFGGGSGYRVEDRDQQAGLMTVLKRINSSWREEREELTRDSDELTRLLQDAMLPPVSDRPALTLASASESLPEVAADSLYRNFDADYGGYLLRGPTGAKSPGTDRLLSALQLNDATKKAPDARILKTLDAMLDGSLLDHLGGGFFTHCRDREWRIPHFEKRLVDNLLLAEAFASAYSQTDQSRYRRASEETLSFVLSQLSNPEGGFYIALSDETAQGDGTYYLWAREEIQEALPPDEFAVVRRYYALNDSPHLDRYYVLRQAQTPDVIADDLGLTVEQVGLRLKQGQTRLLDVRQRRRSPERDEKILLASNGIAIRSLVRCGMLLNRPEYLREAEKCALFLLTNLRDDGGRLHHAWMSGEAHGRAFLEDYAALVQGLLALYAAGNDEKWLNAAIRLHRDELAYFGDDTAPGYFHTPRDGEDLLIRYKPWRDSALPSGNSLTLQNQVTIARLTSDSAGMEALEESWRFFAPIWNREPEAVPGLVQALDDFIRGNESDSVIRLTQGGGSRRVVTLAAQKKNADESAKGTSAKKTKKDSPVEATVYLSVDRLPVGEKIPFIIRMKMEEGWHVNANKPGNEFAVATELELKSTSKTKISRILFPKGDKVQEEGLEGFTYQYAEQADIKGLLEVPAGSAGKPEELTFTITFQACNKERCLKPDELTATVNIEIASEGEAVNRINQKLFEIPRRGASKN
ncbi:MAG: DUF255 domain-containing protein [Planctomycetaceae bacterium]|nr:DUF255 domain-containing protein [Planctomycetaceae bacterium]